jgi:hypothetical protein
MYDDDIFTYLKMREDFDRDSVKTNGKVDPIRAGLKYADYVVTGNDMRNEIESQYGDLKVDYVKIQGSPSDVSTKFAAYYNNLS